MTKREKNKYYNDLCIGWNYDMGEFIRLNLMNGKLYKKSKVLDELSFLDLRIQKAWNKISEIENRPSVIFVDERLNVWGIHHKELPLIPQSKFFNWNKTEHKKFKWIFNCNKGKMIKSPKIERERSKDLNRILVKNFLNEFTHIEDHLILSLVRKARNLPDYLEMFDYSTKSFLDIKIIDDLALQFDLERQNSFKHFVYYCLDKSNQKELIKYEIGLYYSLNSKGWRFYQQQLSSRNNF